MVAISSDGACCACADVGGHGRHRCHRHRRLPLPPSLGVRVCAGSFWPVTVFILLVLTAVLYVAIMVGLAYVPV